MNVNAGLGVEGRGWRMIHYRLLTQGAPAPLATTYLFVMGGTHSTKAGKFSLFFISAFMRTYVRDRIRSCAALYTVRCTIHASHGPWLRLELFVIRIQISIQPPVEERGFFPRSHARTPEFREAYCQWLTDGPPRNAPTPTIRAHNVTHRMPAHHSSSGASWQLR
jgi:hypothetical protein